MDVEDILKLERHPFDEDVLNDDMQNDGVGTARLSHNVRIHLYLLYYQRIFKIVGVQWPFQTDMVFMNKMSRNYWKDQDVVYVNQKERKNIVLFDAIMNWSSWTYDKMIIEDDHILESREAVESYILTTDNGTNLGNCSCAEWKSMVMMIPELYIDSTESLEYIEIYICWNRKLASYLRFRNCNKEVVKTTFLEGDQTISQILVAISDPLQCCTGLDYKTLMTDRYVLGFYAGADDMFSTTFRNLHMHFGLNLIVLELLLDAAVSMFNL